MCAAQKTTNITYRVVGMPDSFKLGEIEKNIGVLDVYLDNFKESKHKN